MLHHYHQYSSFTLVQIHALPVTFPAAVPNALKAMNSKKVSVLKINQSIITVCIRRLIKMDDARSTVIGVVGAAMKLKNVLNVHPCTKGRKMANAE